MECIIFILIFAAYNLKFYFMKITCTCKLWIDSIVVRPHQDGSVITYTMRDGCSRTSNEVVIYGVKKQMSSMSNLINMLLENYEDIIISRK